MPVTLEMIEKRVLILTISTPWDVKDLMSVYPQEQVYYDAATEKIYSLIDLTHIGTIPAGALRARVSPMLMHPKSAQVCIVGANAVAHVMAETVFKLTRYERIMFYQTVDEAWAYLRPLLDNEATQKQQSPAATQHSGSPVEVQNKP